MQLGARTWLSGTLWVALVGCQIIGGFDGFDVGAVPASGGGGAGGTGGADGGHGGEDQCALIQAPERAVDAPPSPVTQELILAARRINMGEGDGVEGGLDLDGRCTCSENTDCPCAQGLEACTRPAGVEPEDWKACDEPGGVDANSKRAFGLATQLGSGFDTNSISESVARGEFTFLFLIRGYNGLANDDTVLVGVLPTSHIDGDPCDETIDPLPATVPNWDGQDRWPVDAASTPSGFMGCDPPFLVPANLDENAYVVDHQVVAHLDRATLITPLNGIPLRLEIENLTLILPLEEGPKGWTITGGTAAGVWPMANLLSFFADIEDSMLYVCDPPTIALTRQLICPLADMPSDGNEGGGCDAVSFYIGFDAEPARIGARVEIPKAQTPCEAVANIDCNEEP